MGARVLRSAATDFPGSVQKRAELAEIAALKKEVARLKVEWNILKRGATFSRTGGDMRFAFIARHCHICPVSWLRKALEVSILVSKVLP